MHKQTSTSIQVEKINELKDRVQLIDLVNWGKYDLVKVLLNKSGRELDVNEKNSLGDFAAIVAAKNNNLPMLKLLCQYGADLSLKDTYGRTVIGWAQYHKNEKMVKFIAKFVEEQKNKSIDEKATINLTHHSFRYP